jgi:hypothetical protein
MTRKLTIAALSAALLLGTAGISAYALDANVNGGSSTVGVHVGSGSGSLATVNSAGNPAGGSTTTGGVNLGGTPANGVGNGAVDGNAVNVNLGGNGPLATVDSNGNPVDGSSATNADINLGGLLGVIGGTGPGGAGGGDGTGIGAGGSTGAIQASFNSLSSGDQHKLKVRCADVLAGPGNYKTGVVSLCKLIAQM